MTSRFFGFQALLWLTYAVVHFAASIPAVQPGQVAELLLMQTVRGATGFAVTSLLAPLLLRASRSIVRLALFAVGAAFVWMLLDRSALVAIAPLTPTDIPWNAVPRGLDLEYLFVIVAWIAGYIGLQTMARNATLEIEAHAARGQALTAQLNSHFLFNTLNMIRSLIIDDPATARDMVTRMSNLLRRVLANDGAEEATVAEEFNYIDDYLAIQKARFGQSLHIDVDVDTAAEPVLLPRLILQPLVENAFKFGRAGTDDIRRVSVSARLVDGSLMLNIENTGELDTSAARGVGTQITTARLARMYGAAQTFELIHDNGMVKATIVIERPRHTARKT